MKYFLALILASVTTYATCQTKEDLLQISVLNAAYIEKNEFNIISNDIGLQITIS